MAGPLDSASVQRVRNALKDVGSAAAVIELAHSARTAQDAANALGTELGSIVKSLVFVIGDTPVMALIAGDRQCNADALPGVLGLEGEVRRADAAVVRAATGFAIGGVAPVGHPEPLPLAIDASLGRFAVVYAAAGHPHCVFPTSLEELARMTPGIVAMEIAREG
ncbi:MAG: YbaK/EbsC family protein [Rhodospirillaceae bacterium]